MWPSHSCCILSPKRQPEGTNPRNNEPNNQESHLLLGTSANKTRKESTNMESQMNINPPLCAAGCGFYASVRNSNLCSKCYGEHQKKELSKSAIVAASIEGSLNQSTLSLPNSSVTSGSQFSFSSDSSANIFFGVSVSTDKVSFSNGINTNANSKVNSLFSPTESTISISSVGFSFGASTSTEKRCNSCNKRVGLTGFECRCGNVFCGKHRYPDEHACEFDYKAFGRDALIKQNPVCKADKLQHRI